MEPLQYPPNHSQAGEITDPDLRELLGLLAQRNPGLTWILDIDNMVKPLYGHQEGAEIGYNPHKPGRPNHNYHSYFVANLRLCLGVEVLLGK